MYMGHMGARSTQRAPSEATALAASPLRVRAPHERGIMAAVANFFFLSFRRLLNGLRRLPPERRGGSESPSTLSSLRSLNGLPLPSPLLPLSRPENGLAEIFFFFCPFFFSAVRARRSSSDSRPLPVTPPPPSAESSSNGLLDCGSDELQRCSAAGLSAEAG